MPHPRKLTPEKREQVLAAMRAGADIAMAARAIGVSHQAIEHAIEREPAWKAEVQRARDFADETIVKRLYDKAREGDVTAMIFWLKNRHPGEWQDRRHHDVAVGQMAGAAPLQITFRYVRGVGAEGVEPPAE